MKKLKIIFLLVFSLTYLYSFSQGSLWMYKFAAKLRHNDWIVGGGWNVVDDDGSPFQRLFKADKDWNIPPYPSRLFCQKVIDENKGWAVELATSYNRFAKGNMINSTDLVSAGQTFFGVDAAAIYNFNKLYDVNPLLVKDKEILRPYAHMGFGYTYRAHGPYFNTASVNLGLGLYIWVYQGWGIQIQSVSKIAMAAPFIKTGANYMQHSIGVAYKFKQRTF